MIIELDIASSEPIYSQLVRQIKRGILNGTLQSGDNLPSVRRLAGDIGINLHTVNKSYKELVEEGLVTQVKKGFKIAEKTPPDISQEYLEKVKWQLESVLIDAAIFDLDIEKLINEVNQNIKGDETNE